MELIKYENEIMDRRLRLNSEALRYYLLKPPKRRH